MERLRILAPACALLLSCGALAWADGGSDIPGVRYQVRELSISGNYAWGDPWAINDLGYVTALFHGRYQYLSQVMPVRTRVPRIRNYLPKKYLQITSLVLNGRGQAVGWVFAANGKGCIFTRDRNRSFCINTDPAEASFVSLNDSGAAVGYCRETASGPDIPFILDKAVITPLAAPVQPFYPMKINNRGQIIGLGSTPEGYVVLTWEHGGWRDEGFTANPDLAFVDIDENDNIILVTARAGEAYSYIASGLEVRDLGSLPALDGDPRHFTAASGFGRNGTVVGLSNGRPFVWSAGRMRDINQQLVYRDQRDFSCRGDVYPVLSPDGRKIACRAAKTRTPELDTALVLEARMLGDLNNNGYVRGDRQDYRSFDRCRQRSQTRAYFTRRCQYADFDANGAVDALDAAVFMTRYCAPIERGAMSACK